MKEIIYPKYLLPEETRQYEEGAKCYCGGRLFRSTIPCPDFKEGCLVVHYGYRCADCGKIFQ